MSTEIVKANTLPFAEIMTISKAFAESSMFTDAKSAAQAFVKISAGNEIGIPPFAAMSGIHIIQGKPTMGAGLMAARLKGSGKYDYRVLQHDDSACEIEVLQGNKSIGKSKFTFEDAKKAQTKNLDKFPRNMLFARAMSNAVRWFAPDIFNGPVYTPEEMGEIEPAPTQDVTPVSVTTAPAAPQSSKKTITPATLKKLADRITNGELDALGKSLEFFTFTDAQLQELATAALKNALPRIAAGNEPNIIDLLNDTYKLNDGGTAFNEEQVAQIQEAIKPF